MACAGRLDQCSLHWAAAHHALHSGPGCGQHPLRQAMPSNPSKAHAFTYVHVVRQQRRASPAAVGATLMVSTVSCCSFLPAALFTPLAAALPAWRAIMQHHMEVSVACLDDVRVHNQHQCGQSSRECKDQSNVSCSAHQHARKPTQTCTFIHRKAAPRTDSLVAYLQWCCCCGPWPACRLPS